ncbi:MAG: RNA-binding cell elongation regulator Jag/EloR [Thermodesulfobacteriota bacterium]
MKSIEMEGKTIEEAIHKACAELNAAREDLEIEVLSNGSSGFLGLVGAKKALIRATLKSSAEKTPSPLMAPASSSDSLAEKAQKTLKDILSFLGMEAKIQIKDEPDRLLLSFKGDGSGLLIGRKGQTLEALEYLVNKIVHKGAEDKKKIVVDTENYRARREEALIKMAKRMGEKAKRTGKPVTMSPLNAHERRIVHLALQNDKALRTHSKGTGIYRKIVISPEKKPS